MMNKKGFTAIELIVSFVLVVTIGMFLLQIVLILKDIFVDSSVKTELMTKQSNLSNLIYKALDKGIIEVNCTDNNMINFIYSDNSSQILTIDKDKNLITFGSYTTSLDNDSYFNDISANVIYSGDNRILKIVIPIENEDYKDDNFDINIVYPISTYTTINLGC